nr:recombinase family protein [uncultured Tyzzerella sp.]
MKKAVAYVRMSTDKQDYSIESQKRTIKEYAKKNNYKIINYFEDELAIIRLNLINLELSRGLIKSYFFIFLNL